MENFSAGAHNVLPRGDRTVTFQGVFTNDRSIADVETGEESAQECTLVITLHVDQSRLDGDIVRVGFRGAHNGDIYTLEVPAHMQYRNGLVDLVFPMHRAGKLTAAAHEADESENESPAKPSAPEEERHSYVGAFFVETSSDTYYWLKYRGESDFRFEYSSLPTLATLVPVA